MSQHVNSGGRQSCSRDKRSLTAINCAGVALLCCALSSDTTAADTEVFEPILNSLFPIGGCRSATFEIELRGDALSRTSGIWFRQSDGLEATVLPDSGTDQTVRLKLTVRPNAKVGPGPLRLVTPHGVCNALYFHVHAEPVIAESEPAKQRRKAASQAQIIPVPAMVHGRITRQGEQDFYAFDVEDGDELEFQVLLSRQSLKKGFRPQLTLYDPTGSWFDPEQLTRLAFHTEIVEGKTPSTTTLASRFDEAGRYLLQIGSER